MYDCLSFIFISDVCVFHRYLLVLLPSCQESLSTPMRSLFCWGTTGFQNAQQSKLLSWLSTEKNVCMFLNISQNCVPCINIYNY